MSEKYSDVLAALQGKYDTKRLWDQVLIARGEREGKPLPELAALSPAELAKADRFLQVKNTSEVPVIGPIVGIGDAIGNIGYDAIKSSGALPAVASAVAKIPGMSELGSLAQPDQTTSPPNFLGNSKATLAGYSQSDTISKILRALGQE